MKIRDKLTLWFSLSITLILILVGFTITYFSDQYRQNEFFNRLKQRIEITEKIFLEKENFSEEDFNTIQLQFLNKLPEETEEVVLLESNFRQKLALKYPESFLSELLEKQEAYFLNEPRQGAGKIFSVKKHQYLVLLTAVDKMGIQLSDHLQTIVTMALIICVLVIVLISFLVSRRMISPISRTIQKANSISARNLHERLTVFDADDEMDQLAIAFNNLLDRVADAFETQKLFINNASHEIRNPLTAIMGETEFALNRERTSSEYIESLKAVSLEADRLNILVNNLLQLSKIGYKSTTFNNELIDLKILLFKTKEKIDFLYPTNQVLLRLKNEDPDEGSGLLIKGNFHLLETCFINLIDNACKFSDFKLVDICVLTKNKGLVSVVIKDQGLGIPKDELSNIMEPFHRASNVRHIKGTGIGMALTRKILELHGGKFEIQSTIDVGTEVVVTFPTASFSSL